MHTNCIGHVQNGEASGNSSFQQWIALGWAPLDAKYRAKKYGQPNPSNPKHLPTHLRPWKEGDSIFMDPPVGGASESAHPGTSKAPPSERRSAHASAFRGSRSRSPLAQAPGRHSHSQLQRSASTDAPLHGKRRGVIPFSYAPVKPDGPAPKETMSVLWAYDVEVEKFAAACSRGLQILETLESDHDDVMKKLRALSSSFTEPTAAPARGDAWRDIRSLAAAGIAAYNGVLQQLQVHGHSLKRQQTMRSQRAAAISSAKATLEAARKAVQARKASLEAFIELNRVHGTPSEQQQTLLGDSEAQQKLQRKEQER